MNDIVAQLRANVPGYVQGWGGPEYTSWQDEQLSWKTTCYIGDWSFLPDVLIEGPDALALIRRTSINSMENFATGRAKHLVQCSESGSVIAEGLLLRLGETRFSTQGNTGMWLGFLIEQGGHDVTWRRQDSFQFQVSGPTALAACQSATGEAMDDIGFLQFREMTVAGRPVLAVRQGMAGEVGFEFHGAAADAAVVHDALVAAGQPLGMRRLGHRTAMINHLEAAFPTAFWHFMVDWFSTPGFAEWVGRTWQFAPLVSASATPFYRLMAPCIRGSFEGRDISDYFCDPVELGWGKSIKFDHDFTGRAALERAVANPRRQRVTLEFDPDDVAEIYASLFRAGEPYTYLEIPQPALWLMWADQVMVDGRSAGISTVPGYSYFFRRVLALAYLEPWACVIGSTVTIIWGNPGTPQKEIRATVAAAPYKTDRRRG